jgi:hypothetical protein
MGIIKPYSSLDTKEKVPVNTDNFPGIVSHFPCSETSGLTMTDGISGAVFTPTAGTMTFGTANALTFDGDQIVNTFSSGSIPDLITGTALFIAIVDYDHRAAGLSGVGYGDVINISNANIGLWSNTGPDASYAFGARFGNTTFDTIPTAGQAIAVDLTGSSVFNHYGNSDLVTEEGSDTNSTLEWGAEKLHIRANATTSTHLYNMMLFNLETLPDPNFIKAMLEWMLYESVVNNNKNPYPGLIGMSLNG